MATVGYAAHDGVVGSQLMFAGSIGIRGTENYIALGVIGNCDVLVATAYLDGEYPVLLV